MSVSSARRHVWTIIHSYPCILWSVDILPVFLINLAFISTVLAFLDAETGGIYISCHVFLETSISNT